MVRVLELFAGIGACSKALSNLGIEHEIVDAVEIDKFAIKSFNAIHGTDFEPQDITKWNKPWYCTDCHRLIANSEIDTYQPDDYVDFVHKACGHLATDACGNVDLLMHGSPCQSFSIAGLGHGGDKGSGTRSSLMWETVRIVEELTPKYVIWENVKNILSEKHLHNFEAYLEAMAKLGYKSKFEVLNAKDFGVPQNRERVFTVSIRRDIADKHEFNFPVTKLPTPKLSSVLEDVVDESYYLDKTHLSKCVISEKDSGEVANLNYYNYDKMNRVYGVEGCTPALETMTGGNRQPKVLEPAHHRIRRLTPRECWRLMGFDDADFEKAQKVNSDTQLYKQSGNSICVPVLENIIKNFIVQ